MFDQILRWAIVLTGLYASVAVATVLIPRWRARHVDRGEALRMAGGCLLCFAVSSGTLGFMSGWDTAWRLPLLLLTLLWVAAGATRERLAFRGRRKRR